MLESSLWHLTFSSTIWLLVMAAMLAGLASTWTPLTAFTVWAFIFLKRQTFLKWPTLLQFVHVFPFAGHCSLWWRLFSPQNMHSFSPTVLFLGPRLSRLSFDFFYMLISWLPGYVKLLFRWGWRPAWRLFRLCEGTRWLDQARWLLLSPVAYTASLHC